MELIPIVLLVLLAVGVIAGFGVLVINRRGGDEEPPPTGGTITREAPPPSTEEPEVEALSGEATPAEAPLTGAVTGTPVESTAEAPPPETEAEAEPEAPVKPSFRDRLAKARSALAGYVGSIVGHSGIDTEVWNDLEEALIRADVGVGPATELIESVQARVSEEGIEDGTALIGAVKAEMKLRLAVDDRTLASGTEDGLVDVWLFVGVNGVGKTTTIGKVAKREAEVGRRVVVAAGDTFRAAATEQLAMWADRGGAHLVSGAEGADPSSVIFDGIERAASRGDDLVLADTAGRLHTKTNLMDELAKVRRVAAKPPGNVVETLLVLDATTGQNGLAQARQFTEAVDVSGVVLTKLDGSAKGGIVFAIQAELGIPVKLVGLGETADDLVAFDPDAFVEALFEG